MIFRTSSCLVGVQYHLIDFSYLTMSGIALPELQSVLPSMEGSFRFVMTDCGDVQEETTFFASIV